MTTLDISDQIAWAAGRKKMKRVKKKEECGEPAVMISLWMLRMMMRLMVLMMMSLMTMNNPFSPGEKVES